MSVAVEAPVASANDSLEIRQDRRSRIRDAYWVGGVSSLCFGISLLLYQVWNANLHLPMGYSSDTTFVTSLIKGIRQNGWWLHNPHLGAPFVQDMRDFPASGQSSQLAILRIIVDVVHSPGLTVNIYFFGGFAVLAAVSFLVFRRLGLSAPVSAGLAIAYDFLPFHFWHGPDHLFHSTYFTAPLAVLLLVRLLEPEPRFLRNPRAKVTRPFFGPDGSILVKPFVSLIVMAVVIGCSEEMISTFTTVLLVISGLLAAIAFRRVSRLTFGLVFAGTIVGVFVLLSAPTVLHVMSAGKNQVAAKRYVFESDLYGLRPAFMLLPTTNHWITAMSTFAKKLLVANHFPSEGGQAIGTIGALGVFGAVGMLLSRALRPDSDSTSTRRRPPAIALPLAMVIVLAIILGTGGATFLDVISGFTQVRTWNWIVLIIAFAAFVLTGFGCERIVRFFDARTSTPKMRWLVPVVLVVVLGGVGILDGGRPPLPNGKVKTATWTSDLTFVAAMHTVQPPNGMIFQFPVVRFPESAKVNLMPDYSQLRGYLADAGNFSWSYGAVKGRPEADWQLKLGRVPLDADLRALVGLGFTGLWVNRDGYVDHAVNFEAKMFPLLGKPNVTSPDGQLIFYDLRPYAAKIPPGTDLAAEARARFGITAPKHG